MSRGCIHTTAPANLYGPVPHLWRSELEAPPPECVFLAHITVLPLNSTNDPASHKQKPDRKPNTQTNLVSDQTDKIVRVAAVRSGTRALNAPILERTGRLFGTAELLVALITHLINRGKHNLQHEQETRTKRQENISARGPALIINNKEAESRLPLMQFRETRRSLTVNWEPNGDRKNE